MHFSDSLYDTHNDFWSVLFRDYVVHHFSLLTKHSQKTVIGITSQQNNSTIYKVLSTK